MRFSVPRETFLTSLMYTTKANIASFSLNVNRTERKRWGILCLRMATCVCMFVCTQRTADVYSVEIENREWRVQRLTYFQ